MDFVVTEELYSVYEDTDDERAVIVDEVIRRLLVEHSSGWARQGRIEGEKGGAWIITLIDEDFEGVLYWGYLNQQAIVLIALVIRHR